MCRQGEVLKRALGASAVAAVLALAGCGDRVEFHGKVFEAVGLTNTEKTAPKDVPTRAPLVLPPTNNLPPPGEQTAAAAPNWPNDPNQQIEQAEAERKRKQEEYYQKGDWSGKGGIDEFNKLMDPLERRPGLFGGEKVKDKYRDEQFRDKNAKAEEPPEEPGPWTTETQTQPATQ